MSEDTQITITKDSKSFIIRTVGICFAGLLTLGVGVCGYTKYQDYRVEQAELKKQKAHKDAQAIIKAMIDTCNFNRISPDEQASIDKCGDDVDAAYRAVTNIVDSRVVYWGNQLADVKERAGKLMAIKNNAQFWTVENENEFREVGKKLIDQHNLAEAQVKIWDDTRARLKNFDTTKAPETTSGNNLNNT